MIFLTACEVGITPLDEASSNQGVEISPGTDTNNSDGIASINIDNVPDQITLEDIRLELSGEGSIHFESSVKKVGNSFQIHVEPKVGFSVKVDTTFNLLGIVYIDEKPSCEKPIHIMIEGSNTKPIAYGQDVRTEEYIPVSITLRAKDDDGDDLKYSVSRANNGTVILNGNIAVYSPDIGFSGTDSFQFRVNDGYIESGEATVNLVIHPSEIKQDATKPLITLNGSSTVTLVVGDTYIDAGATAHDNVDGNITANIIINNPVDTNTAGTYIVTYDVNDTAGNVATQVTRTVIILDGNVAPVAQGASYVMDEDTNLTINLEGNDSDVGAVLTYFIVDNPTNGNISLVGNEVIYVPDTNYFGIDGFTFEIRDEFNATSNVASIDINISDVAEPNTAPVAQDMNISMDSNISTITFNLNASDADGDDLNYSIVSTPANGSLSDLDATTGKITYGTDGYIGNTSFTYRINDGKSDSNVATVNIVIRDTIKPSITLSGLLTVTLTIGDTYIDAGATAHDNVDGNITANIIINNPVDTNTAGTYIVTYDVNDTAGNVATQVTRTVIILDGNVAPVAQGASYVMDEDTNLTINLEGNDSDVGAVLTYFIVDNPTNGNISLVGNEVIYVPDTNYFGIDGFTFEIRDEFNATSNVASIDINISDVAEPNTAPVAQDMNISMDSNISTITFNLSASDADTATLTYTIVEAPTFGTLTQAVAGGKDIAYTRGSYTGNVNFTYKVNDGIIDSNIATVYIKSNIPNVPPVAYDMSVNLDEGRVQNIILDANDSDMTDTLIYRISENPSYGSITIVNNIVTYTPNTGFTGTDSFTFVANDGTDDSNVGYVFVRVGNTQLTSQLFAWCKTNDVELWRTDGTIGGTGIVKDIHTSGSAKPQSFVKIKNTYFFVADDGIHGAELWKSQGTEGSTVLVKDIKPMGKASSSPHNLIDINGTLFFAAKDGKSGIELWKSDGTTIGTKRVKNINPLGNSKPDNLTNVNGVIYFVADDGQNGRELWKSDGTKNGTKQVDDINNGGSSNPKYLTNINGVLYFSADDGGTLGIGRELWFHNTNISDEASNYTNRGFYNLHEGLGSSNPKNLFNYNGVLVFSADDGIHGHELWKKDGLEIAMVENYAGDNTVFGDYRYLSSSPHSFTIIKNTLYFSARQFINGRNLRKIDNSDASIELVTYEDKNNTFRIPNPENLISVNDTLLFSTYQRLKDDKGNVIGEQIFQGTPEGYYVVHSDSRVLTNYGVIDNMLLFRITSPDGNEVLKLNDGTRVRDLLNGCEL